MSAEDFTGFHLLETEKKKVPKNQTKGKENIRFTYTH